MISTQVVDTALGQPAERLPVVLDRFHTEHGWQQVGHGLTDGNGEIPDFGEPPAAAIYRLTYDVEAYFPEAFYPTISVTFQVRDAGEHHHLPLLISRHGYSTYKAV